ncbi:PQQ-like beta-propeller repeat protein, partial [Saccharothrix sp. MB29]|nr:PQQ-like beta-propeller repeat protein [Saccharothrix sp. MB29]
ADQPPGIGLGDLLLPPHRAGRGRKMVGIGQKSGVYHVFDAVTGEVVWRRQLSTPQPNLGLTGIQWGTSYDGKALYIATWRANPGALHALDPATGDLLWKTPTPANGCDWGGAAQYRDLCELSMTPAVSSTPGLVFEGSGDGKMRAFSARNGRVLWEYDTMQNVQGVNGLPGRGGSLAGGGGAVIVDGMVYVQSGYWMPQYPNDRGHVMLAFGL